MNNSEFHDRDRVQYHGTDGYTATEGRITTCDVCGLRGMTNDEIEDSARGGRTPLDVCPGDHQDEGEYQDPAGIELQKDAARAFRVGQVVECWDKGACAGVGAWLRARITHESDRKPGHYALRMLDLPYARGTVAHPRNLRPWR